MRLETVILEYLVNRHVTFQSIYNMKCEKLLILKLNEIENTYICFILFEFKIIMINNKVGQ